MKRNAIVRIIIYSLLCVILFGVLIAGAKLTPAQFFGRKQSEKTQHASLPISEEGISCLDIQWAAGAITIEPADVEEITLTEFGGSDPMVVHTSGNKMEILFSESKGLFGLNLKNNLSKDLRIEVPRDWKAENISIESAAADIQINQLDIGTLNVDTASGEVTLMDCNVGSIDLDSASGNLNFTGTLKELDMDGASAKATVLVYNVPDAICMDSMSGDLNLTLPKDACFEAKKEGLSGSFHSDFETRSNGSNSYSCGSGGCRIDVDGLSAALYIHAGSYSAVNFGEH